jgi:hypothetical protein
MPSNTTILEIIRTVLPEGSNLDSKDWQVVCKLAAVATLTERSGLYSETTFTDYWSPKFVLSDVWLRDICDVGYQWSGQDTPPAVVQDLWKKLVGEYGNARIDDSSDASIPWKVIIFKLLTIADGACAGIGFPPESSDAVIQYIYYQDHIAWSAKGAGEIGGNVLPYIPNSLCQLVPPAVACVQPKTNTPEVGCTLRSLTHNLALLPSIGNVATYWYLTEQPYQDGDPFNVLIVPFPFSIPGKSFSGAAGNFPGSANERAFCINPNAWMNGASAEDFANDFLFGLLQRAEQELERVHAVVLPELALRLDLANKLAEILSQKTELDLFVTGVLAGNEGQARNTAPIYQFSGRRVINRSFQAKHHRWCLNGDQINRYHLGHVLSPQYRWWEQIDVSHRDCYVTQFRPGATLSVLICEDLARYDPVVTVMNAIGPNLVIALLMDGPQLEQRWPGRYATVLAEDPGSVLTITSLAMTERSTMPGDPPSREIALWKERSGRARTLRLPRGDHALLLTLTSRFVEQFTLDGRGDERHTVQFGLGAARGIRHPNSPPWLEYVE